MSSAVRLFFVQERLSVAQEAVRAELTALNRGLQKRQQAAKVKALLELMQDTAHVMSKAGPMRFGRCATMFPFSVPQWFDQSEHTLTVTHAVLLPNA